MAYDRSQMVLNQGGYYKWMARSDHDNPNIRAGLDHKELNKTEGYEVLGFINRYAAKWTWRRDGTVISEPSLSAYQQMERMIKEAPPRSTHQEVAEWILEHWQEYK